jgi:hypothetical protein
MDKHGNRSREKRVLAEYRETEEGYAPVPPLRINKIQRDARHGKEDTNDVRAQQVEPEPERRKR